MSEPKYVYVEGQPNLRFQLCPEDAGEGHAWLRPAFVAARVPADLVRPWQEEQAPGTASPVVTEDAPEAVRAEHLRYLRDLAERAYDASMSTMQLSPEVQRFIQLGLIVPGWRGLTPVQQDGWLAAAGAVVSAIWSEMEGAIERAQVRTDSPLVKLTEHAARLRHREQLDEHYATTRRAGIAVQPAPAVTDNRETWFLVVEDTATYLPADEARTLLQSDMRERNRLGKHRYGTALSPHNGRDSLVDAYQEALDKTVYLKNVLVELEDEGRTLDSRRDERSVADDLTRKDAVAEEYGEALLAAHRLRVLVGTRDRFGGSADSGT